MESLKFYEFFSGGGLARIGLGQDWDCVFANDISPKKGASYRENFGEKCSLTIRDVTLLNLKVFNSPADMAWASFPCQDLSLAGNGVGINGSRSGAFWGFWKIICDLTKAGKRVPIIALENVVGLLTTNNGNDFSELMKTLVSKNYKVGAFVMDAVNFVPHSRPRLFVVAVSNEIEIQDGISSLGPQSFLHPQKLLNCVDRLPNQVKEKWIWWNTPSPSPRRKKLEDIFEKEPLDVKWHSELQTQRILSLMSKVNRDKIKQAKALKKTVIGALYRRTRVEKDLRVQRWEVRFDGLSGCLRTPAGGSSRQVIMEIDNQKIRTRLISKNEMASLMGLNSNYVLPESYNDAYHLLGDAVVVPVVSFISKNLLLPLGKAVRCKKEMVA